MKFAHTTLTIACLTLLLSGAAWANDPPKEAPKADAKADPKADSKADAKAEPKKDAKKDGKEPPVAEAPPESNLPSKPYPKSAAPKAFEPRGELKKSDAPPPEPAIVFGTRPSEKMVEKPSMRSADKFNLSDKPASMEMAQDKPILKKSKPRAKPAAREVAVPLVLPTMAPMLAQVAGESLQGNSPELPYQVQPGDTLERVIRKTMPKSPFSMEVMREAFGRANPELINGSKEPKLKPGSTLNLPSLAVMRQVVLGESPPLSEPMRMKVRADLYGKAPVLAPTVAPSTVEAPFVAVPRMPINVASRTSSNSEVPAEEKKKWVHYP